MKIYRYIYLVAAIIFASCHTEESPEPDIDERGTYLHLNINMADGTGSRSGIANGYGYEEGVRRENSIYNITLFFYQGEGPNDDADFYRTYYVGRTPVFTSGNGSANYIIQLSDFHPNEGDRILLVANMGDLSSIGSTAELRDNTAKAWQQSGILAECDMFAMSSCRSDDGLITTKSSDTGLEAGTKGNPFIANVTVERLAARIDLWFDRDNIDGNRMKYTTSGGNGTVYITDATPVNAMQQNTYVLKHVSTGLDDLSATGVCGNELSGDDGLPANYVIEPSTTQKGDKEMLPEWYGATSAGTFTTFPGSSSISTLLGDERLRQTTAGEHSIAMTVAYANENTYPASQATASHVTGLALRAVFVPDGMTYGSDFWRVRNEDSDESKSLYFATAAEANEFVSATPGYLAPEYYPGGVCYYSIWLRHRLENTSEETVYPMEFATVRNHIYRVALSFRGPGKPYIDLSEPEEHVAEIYVRRWNFKRLNGIIM